MLRRELRSPPTPAAARRPRRTRPDPDTANLLALQRGAGNHAVARMLRTRTLARELKPEQIRPLLQEYKGWGLHFEWSDPELQLTPKFHEDNYKTLATQLANRKLPNGVAEIKQLAQEIATHAGRSLIVAQIPFADQIMSAIDPAILFALSNLLAEPENAWVLQAWSLDEPKGRDAIIRYFLEGKRLRVDTVQQDNALIAWREGMLTGTDPFSLARMFIPSKDSGATKSKHDKECGDLSLMKFLGLTDKHEAAKLFGKDSSGETENVDILRVLSQRSKPLVIGRPMPWDKAEALLAGSGPWYVLVFYNEPMSPETLGHAIVMEVAPDKKAPGDGELAWESGSRRYLIFDPQKDLDRKKPLDATRWIMAWGA